MPIIDPNNKPQAKPDVANSRQEVSHGEFDGKTVTVAKQKDDFLSASYTGQPSTIQQSRSVAPLRTKRNVRLPKLEKTAVTEPLEVLEQLDARAQDVKSFEGELDAYTKEFWQDYEAVTGKHPRGVHKESKKPLDITEVSPNAIAKVEERTKNQHAQCIVLFQAKLQYIKNQLIQTKKTPNLSKALEGRINEQLGDIKKLDETLVSTGNKLMEMRSEIKKPDSFFTNLNSEKARQPWVLDELNKVCEDKLSEMEGIITPNMHYVESNVRIGENYGPGMDVHNKAELKASLNEYAKTLSQSKAELLSLRTRTVAHNQTLGNIKEKFDAHIQALSTSKEPLKSAPVSESMYLKDLYNTQSDRISGSISYTDNNCLPKIDELNQRIEKLRDSL